VSKVLATVAVMQLVESGKVGLDDIIQKYVPSFPEKKSPITLRRILTHTSGIRHYKNGEFGPYGLRELRRFDDIEEAMKHFSDDPLLFESGEYWFYSSHAFNLLQGVIEKASGLKFEDYMMKNLWEPAGMLQSSFDVPERIVHKRGHGYVRNERGVLVHPRHIDVSYKYAGGGMLSTVEDLVRFGTALNDGTLLEPETVETMYTSLRLPKAWGRHCANVSAPGARSRPMTVNWGDTLCDRHVPLPIVYRSGGARWCRTSR
jgi:CubicO group peptidase (beta-lactamase class C family)